MCDELTALRQSIREYAGQFDAGSLNVVQANDVVLLCAQIEASAASIKALAAARVAQGSDWKENGYRSAAHQLAAQAGMSSGAAKRALETGRRLAKQPEVAKAATGGELSIEQATAVADGVASNPAKAKELIAAAKSKSMAELNDEVAKVKADASDLEARRKAHHAKRSLRRWTNRDGALEAHLFGHPEDGATLWRMLDPIRRRLNVLRHQAGKPNQSLDALDYDALMLMASIALGKDGELSAAELLQLGLFPQLASSRPPQTDDSPEHSELFDPEPPAPGKESRVKKLAGSPLRVMIRVDLDSLLRGVPLEGELCEIAGYGAVPVSVIEDLVATENPFIVGLLTNAHALVGVYHHGRHPNAYQRSALDFLHPVCAVEGCPSAAGLQYDHREDFAKTKITAFDLLDRLCGYHHGRKTRDNWALVEGRGKRPFVPPADPRHPRHGGQPPGRSP